MKIYTSYFAKLRNIPKDIEPVAICLKLPEWYNGKVYQKLAPTPNIFYKWKEDQDNTTYIDRYYEEVLNNLDQLHVLKELEALSEGKDIVLICYEVPESFCHRHLVADWLNKVGTDCKEYF